MRPVSTRLGLLAVILLCAGPRPTLAQPATSTEAAIAELRQLLAEQRAALDRQARIIEEQGRSLTALRQQVEGENPNMPGRREPVPQAPAAAADETQAPSSQPASRTAAERAPDLPSPVVSAGDFPGSIRIPGTDSALKLGGQARMVSVHSLKALGTDDRFVTSSIPVGIPTAGEERVLPTHRPRAA